MAFYIKIDKIEETTEKLKYRFKTYINNGINSEYYYGEYILDKNTLEYEITKPMKYDSGSYITRAVMKIVLTYKKTGIWEDETFFAS